MLRQINIIRKIIPILIILLIFINCNALGLISIPTKEIKEKYADSHSKFIKIKGINIHYRDQGRGPVLILVHGVCASLHTWDGWVKELQNNYRIVRIDLPGFGLSDLNDVSIYTRDAAIEFTNEFVKVLNIDHFSIAGNSLGGYLAWIYTLKYPEKVEKLILIDSAGYNIDLPLLLRFTCNPVIRPIARRMMPRFLFNMAVKQVYGDESKVNDRLTDRYFELAMREGNKSNYVDIFTVLQEKSQTEMLSRGIDKITTPAFVMWGTEDIWIPFETQFPKWKKDLQNAEFIVYEGVGHTPMEEIPRQTAHDAHSFLMGQRVKTGKRVSGSMKKIQE